MEFSRFKNFLITSATLTIFIVGFFAALTTENSFYPPQPAAVAAAQNVSRPAASLPLPPPPPPEKLANPPEIIKAVYVTGWSAGTKSYLKYLTNLFKTTEINAVVVDIKDYSGLVSYKSNAEEVKKYNLYNNAIYDIDALVRFFHDQNIYVIGRIAVFEDPAYSKARPELAVYDKAESTDSQKVLWQDNHKLSWFDPASKEVWDYNISIAKDVLAHGFDEVNFDYIRFPSDGKIEKMGFPAWDGQAPKRNILKNFYAYLREQLPDAKLSADLFGQVTVNPDDLGIGQIVEDAFPYFDYVCPMVYPSHYATNFINFENPADHPYEVVKYSMETALSRNLADKNSIAKLRPWLQDFNMGAFYTADMIKSEIKASEDALKDNFVGYLLWSPSNVYTAGAVLKPE